MGILILSQVSSTKDFVLLMNLMTQIPLARSSAMQKRIADSVDNVDMTIALSIQDSRGPIISGTRGTQISVQHPTMLYITSSTSGIPVNPAFAVTITAVHTH